MIASRLAYRGHIVRVAISKCGCTAGLSLAAMMLVAITACAVSSRDSSDAVLELDSPRAIPAPEVLPGSGEANLFAAGGQLHMSWLEPHLDNEWALRFATLNGESWSQVRTVTSSRNFFINWADFPSIIATPGGGLVAHWLERSGEGTYAYDVRLSRSLDGGATWAESFRPHEDGTQTEHGFVSLVPELDGGFTAVWLDGRNTAAVSDHSGGEMTLRSRRYSGDGSAGPEAQLDARICDCCQTSAVYVGDTLIVAYRDRSAMEVRDISVVTRAASGWSQPTAVGNDQWMIPGCPVNGPSMAAQGDLAAVAWFGLVAGTPEVKVAFTDDNGASFSAPVLVERGSTEAATLGRVDLEWISTDTVLVSWLTALGADAEIRYRMVDIDGAIGPANVLAKTSPSRSSGFPRMAREGERVVFVWRQLDEPAMLRMAAISLRSLALGD